ncbi:hypothetical protein ACQY0O_005055 [Thecaphora frezii]
MARRSGLASASAKKRVATPPIKFADAQANIPKKRGGFFSSLASFGIRVAIFYTVFAALWHCPSKPLAFDYSTKDVRPVCRNVAKTHQQLAPILTPYVNKAKVAAEPYTKPAVDTVSPYAKKAWKISRPYYRSAQKRGKLIYKKHVEPARRRAIKKARANADPYLEKLYAQYHRHVQPQVDLIQRHVEPYHNIYRRDVSPYVQQAYQYGLQSSSVSYAFYIDKIHPHVIQTLRHLYDFLINRVDPATRRFYSLYARPQGEKLIAKLYESKARWMGSDTIKVTQQDSQRAARDSAAQGRVAVRAAEEVVLKAQQRPSLIDKIKQAKEAVLAGKKDQDPVEIAKLDAELDAEEERVKEQLETWETGMGSLIEKQYRLAIERLIELRNRAMTDLPDRFGAVSEDFVEDRVAVVLSRIERGLRKLAGTEPLNIRLAKGRDVISQQLARLDQAAEETKMQVADFQEQLLNQEQQVVETSYHEIVRFSRAAKKAYDQIMVEAKFAETMDEWEGWDNGVRKRANLYLQDLSEVQRGERRVNAHSGAPDLHSEAPNLASEVIALRNYLERLFANARREVESFGESCLAQLRGDAAGAKLSDVMDSIADQSMNLSLEASSGMLAAVASARTKLGLKENETDNGYFARAKAYAQHAAKAVSQTAASAGTIANDAAQAVSESGASIVGQTRSTAGIAASASSLAEGASSIFHHATRSAASAAGALVTPESAGEHAEGLKSSDTSLAADVSVQVAAALSTGASAGANIAQMASSAAHQATRGAASAIGVEPTPETLGEHVESLTRQASHAASTLSAASEAVVDAQSFVLQGQPQESVAAIYDTASSQAAAAFSSATSVGNEAADQVASVIAKLTDSAISATGTSTAPTGITEHAASIAQAASNKASEAGVAVSSFAHDASKAGKSVIGATPKPDTFDERADQVLAAAQNKATDGLAAAASAASPVVLLVSEAMSQLSSQYADTIVDAVNQATRSIRSGMEATPSPEGARETLEHVGKKVSEQLKEAAAKMRDEL